MHFDYEWIKTYLKDAPSLEEAARLLNLTGLETEISGTGLEVEHTVNRPDAMCHYGLARELAVKADLTLVDPPIYDGPLPELEGWTIVSEEPEECWRYMALLVENAEATPSPEWLRRRLEAIDQTSHNFLVDLTNFLLWEFSHPSHAFDADKLPSNCILVRRATAGEELTTLDGRTHKVEGMLVITDGQRPIALGGVMGGENTEVDSGTRRVLLEHANFRGAMVRATGNATNIHSDARHRYERGIDPENMERVIRRFIFLLRQEQPEARVVGFRDFNLKPHAAPQLTLRRSQLDRLLGIHIEDAEVERLLARQGFQPCVVQGGWHVQVPGYKVDVRREADVIEELIRFAGLDRLQASLPQAGGTDYAPDRLLTRADKARETLRAIGMQEAICFAFCSPEADALIAGTHAPVEVRNPMTRNQAVMRRNLLPGLLDCLRNNLSRGMNQLALFEIGHTFAPDHEPHHLAVVLSLAKEQANWWGDHSVHPFYRIKGVFEALAQRLDFSSLELRPEVGAWLNAGEALGIYRAGVCIGGFGCLADALCERFKFESAPVVLELDISFLRETAEATANVARLSEFPGMKIDMAFVVAKECPFQDVRAHIEGLNLPFLESLQLFDAYQGKSLDGDKKSLGFRFRFRASDRTLTSEEIASTMERVKHSVCDQFGATVRT